MYRLRRASWGLGLASIALTGAAHGAEPEVSLHWTRLSGAETCIDGRALAVRVEQRLRRAVFSTPASARRSIEGHIAPEKAGYLARISLADEGGNVLGTRELQGPSASCRAMDDELSLVIALLLEPVPLPAPPLPAPRPPPFGGVAPLAPVVRLDWGTSSIQSPPAAPSRMSVRVDAGPVVSLGWLPSAAPGAFVRAAVTPPRLFPLEVKGALFASQRTSSGDLGADLTMAYGLFTICPLAGQTSGFVWSGCAGGLAGSVHVGGFGFDQSLARDVPIGALTLEARVLRTLVSPVFVSVGLGLSVPLVRLDVYFLEGGARREVFSGPPLAGTLEAALGLELW